MRAPDKPMNRREYEKALRTLQVELCSLQDWVKKHGQRVVVVFEGRDAAGKGGVFGANISRIDRRLPGWVLGAIDKSDKIAVVEIAKAMDFIDRRGRVADPGHDLGRQLEAQVHALGANVEEEIAGRGNRMARAGLDLAKGVQLRRPRLAKETIPRVRPNSHDAREI